MKTFLIGMVLTALLAPAAWALTATGMPALDELLADAGKNGPLSRKLGFSDEQRKAIVEQIEKDAPNLVKLRDELVAAEQLVARKEKKGKTKTDAHEEKNKASHALNAARDNAFKNLKPLMNDKQYDALKDWRAAGKANLR